MPLTLRTRDSWHRKEVLKLSSWRTMGISCSFTGHVLQKADVTVKGSVSESTFPVISRVLLTSLSQKSAI